MEKTTEPKKTIKTITIGRTGKGELTVDPDSLHCSVEHDIVKWKSKNEDITDWCVVFGPQAPVNSKSRVATPAKPTLELRNERPEDLRHVKYTVVAWDGKKLVHKDPELIVET